MGEELGDPKRNIALLRAIDKVIKSGSWDKTRFLQAIGKKLADLRINFKKTIDYQATLEKAENDDSVASSGSFAAEGQVEVFISLYNSDGGNMEKWSKILQNLSQTLVSRPIYPQEADARAWIRSRINKKNEAYVGVLLKKSDLIETSSIATPRDKLGNELIISKGALAKSPAVTRFVHPTGIYTFTGKMLKKQSDIEI